MNFENLVFKCSKCGSNKLAHQKYVKCITPVILPENSDLEYGLSKCNEDDYLCADNGYICMNCQKYVQHWGNKFETEKELLDYLTMDPTVRAKEQQDYDEYVQAKADQKKRQEYEAEELSEAEMQELF